MPVESADQGFGSSGTNWDSFCRPGRVEPGCMKQEDRGISNVNYGPLNMEFYEALPHEYFRRRLNSLILQAGRPDEVQRLLHEGVTYRELTLSSAAGHVHNTDDQNELDAYVALEAEVLYFQSVETLLRLYMAHESQPVCPWLELARVRTPGEFKRMLEKRFISDTLDQSKKWELVGPVLIGAPAATFPYPEILEAFEIAMAKFAHDFLNGAARHNSAKHGLAMKASNEHLRVGNGIISSSGIAIKHLDIQGSPKRWHQTTSWADVDMRMALTRIATNLISNIWEVGRIRHTGFEGPPQVYLMDFDLHQFVSRGRPWAMDGFSLSLVYERPDGSFAERTGGMNLSVFNNPPSDELATLIAEHERTLTRRKDDSPPL